MYQFKEEPNQNVFFRFDKKYIRNMKWAQLPMASKSIFPVIAVYCNAKGVAFPSEETIGILSGRTPKTVREGISGLYKYPPFVVKKYVTRSGRLGNIYHINITPNKRGRSFSFFKCIIEGGNWSLLTPGAHAIYPVLKAFSFFDGEEYSALEDTDYGHNVQAMIEDGEYQNRLYNFCNYSIEKISYYSGVTEKTVIMGLKQLEDKYLIEKTDPLDGYDTWKIFEKPSETYDFKWLNKKALKRYGKTCRKILPTKNISVRLSKRGVNITH